VPVSRPSSVSPPFTVLLVCTGNICRSALAERLGRAFLAQVMGEDADQVRIVSAGTRAVVGSAMHPDSALVLRGFGAEPGDFRARQLAEAMVTSADLVLTMTRDHRAEVLRRDPRALARTFTLREAADLLDRMGGAPAGDGTLAERAEQLVQGMAAARSGRQGGTDDDVRDPIGQPIEVHDEVGAVIVDSLLPLLRRIADPRGP
jgi:protein-tyrosine phosphatase